MNKSDYPETRRDVLAEEFFGVRVEDPYRWLEDANSVEVATWTAAQNALTSSYFDELKSLRSQIESEIESLYRYDDISLPQCGGERLFYNRKRIDSNYVECVWRQVGSDEEHLLLDSKQWNPDGALTLGSWFSSPDGRLVVAKILKHNSDESFLRIFDVDSGQVLPDGDLMGARLALPKWTVASDGFYYIGLPPDVSANDPESLGKAQLYFHVIGKTFDQDQVIHPATGDPSLWMACNYFGGQKIYICLYKGHNSTTVISRDLVTGEVVTVFAEEGGLAVMTGFADRAYIMTNFGAPNFRLLQIDETAVGTQKWRNAIPEQEAILMRAIAAGDGLVLCYMQHAKFYLEICDLDGRTQRTILPPGQASTISGITGSPGSNAVYFSVGSFTQPDAYYRVLLSDEAEPTLYYRSKRGADVSIMTRMRFYVSFDGTRVPLFIIKPVGVTQPIPFILKAYGGFGVPNFPEFIPEMSAWVHRGFGFAVACIRGGGEYGRSWHEAGRLANKQNSFNDFCAAAEFLFREGHTTADKLGIWGRSNGGLLVAAAVNQRPELFRAVLCEVPLIDMLRYHHFGIARIWTSEYGDPSKQDEFEFLRHYSPYHNVTMGQLYPTIMVAANAKDDRVDPLHARKFAAALQHATGSKNPVLLYIQQDSGHEGTGHAATEISRKASYIAFFENELSGEVRDTSVF